MGIAGFVLGILSIVGGWIPIVFYFAWAFAVIGIILSVMGRKQAKLVRQPTGLATAGLVLSIIGVPISLVGLIINWACACVNNLPPAAP
jgi:hypothetical protein